MAADNRASRLRPVPNSEPESEPNSERLSNSEPVREKQELVFLSRWKGRAQAREQAIAERLLGKPLTPQEVQKAQNWLRNIASRKLWLEARLEHLQMMENILKRALEL